jgi:hypothetical protein
MAHARSRNARTVGSDIIDQRYLDTIGTTLAICGTFISMIGVCYNNVFLEHTTAMWVWTISNTIFVGYFYGRLKGSWDGGLPDFLLCLNYIVMLITGLYGLLR